MFFLYVDVHARRGQVALEGLRNILQSESRFPEPGLGEDDGGSIVSSDGARVLSRTCQDLCEAARVSHLLEYDGPCWHLS